MCWVFSLFWLMVLQLGIELSTQTSRRAVSLCRLVCWMELMVLTGCTPSPGDAVDLQALFLRSGGVCGG